MTQKNREAFEQWAASEGYLVQKITRPHYGEVYRDESTHRAWKGWQACAAHCAPMPTEKDAVDLIQKAMFEEKHTRGYSGTAIDALKAAGVRFKESGGVGT